MVWGKFPMRGHMGGPGRSLYDFTPSAEHSVEHLAGIADPSRVEACAKTRMLWHPEIWNGVQPH